MIQLLQQSLTKKLFGFATRIGMFWILLGISQAHFLSRNYLNITNLKICTLDNLILHTWNNANRDIKSEYTSYSKVRLKCSKRCEFEPFCHRKKVHLIWMCNKQFSAITMWKLQWCKMYIRLPIYMIVIWCYKTYIFLSAKWSYFFSANPSFGR